jgi:hypothetical protein
VLPQHAFAAQGRFAEPAGAHYIAAMATEFRGLYRTIAWAYVTNGSMAFQVPEMDYRAFGYEPDYDSLPWQESYDAAKGGGLPMTDSAS